MIKVGLTGNIGTGKSTVARIFESLGVPVYHADREAKRMLEETTVKEMLVIKFGVNIFENDQVDRKKLANVVFNNSKKLADLNAIIHPLVEKDLEHFFLLMKDHPYVIQEAAILFESGFDKNFDKIILVTSSEKIANSRVMKRDNVGLQEVEQRRANQWSQIRKIALSDYIIKNDEENMLIPQVLDIHQSLISGK